MHAAQSFCCYDTVRETPIQQVLLFSLFIFKRETFFLFIKNETRRSNTRETRTKLRSSVVGKNICPQVKPEGRAVWWRTGNADEFKREEGFPLIVIHLQSCL